MKSPASLSELLSFLDQLGVHPKKSLSQNFLIDSHVIEKTVQLSGVQSGERILEIGPGPGALTAALLETGAYVTVIEKDRLFAQEIHRFQNGRLEVIEADFLEWPLDHYDRVVGNLPYSITTPILEKICESSIKTFTFMAQKEFAARLKGKPGTKEISSLSIFIESHAAIFGAFDVSQDCFYPRPKVDSTVMRLDFTGNPDPKEFFTFVRRCYGQRRKMITTTLKQTYPIEAIRAALVEAGANPEARPETLTLQQWRSLFTRLCQTVAEPCALV